MVCPDAPDSWYKYQLDGLEAQNITLKHGTWQLTAQTSRDPDPAQLIFWDPYYDLKGQPTHAEFKHLKDWMRAIRQPGSVMIIFTGYQFMHLWLDALSEPPPYNGLIWKPHDSLFTVVRDEAGLKPFNPKVWRSLTEQAMVLVCTQPEGQERGRQEWNWKDMDKVFHRDAGGDHGYNNHANVFLNYKPPTKAQRLKAPGTGKPLRQMAEKGFDLLEYLVLSSGWHGHAGDGVSQARA